MSYARRVAYNTVIQLIGRLLTTGTSLVTVAILNSGLLPEKWGAYVGLTAYIAFFATFADLGVNTLYLRELSAKPEEADDISARFLGFRVVTAVIMLGSAPLIALALPGYHEFAGFIAILALGQFFLVLNQLFVSIVQARLLMGWASLSDLCGRVLVLIGTVLVFKELPANQHLLGVTVVTVGGSLLNMAITYLASRSLVRVRFVLRPKEWPGLLRELAPMSAFVVFGLIHFKADSVILTILQPKVDVGIYGNAYKIAEIYIMLPGMFVGSLFPAFTQTALHDPQRFRVLFQKAFDLILLSVVPLILFTVLFAPYIIAVLTRYNIDQSAYALQILCLTMIPWFVIYLLEYVLVAAGKQGKVGALEGWAALLNIILNFIAIPHWSYIGAAYVTFISEALVLVLVARLFIKVFKYIPSLQVVKAVLGGTILTGGLCFGVFTVVSDLLPRYMKFNRPVEVVFMGVAFILFSGLYILPAYLLDWLPPVLRDRLPRRMTSKNIW